MTQTETASTVPNLEVPTTSGSAEANLANEIADMWRVHTQSRAALHKTRAQLKQIQTELSRRLHELKSVLSRPGRGGSWSSFLEAQAIPRSTADRLVRNHEKALNTEEEIAPVSRFLRRLRSASVATLTPFCLGSAES